MTSSGSPSSPSPPPASSWHQALVLEAGANAYLAFWASLTPVTLGRLASVARDEVRLCDPRADACGRDAVQAWLSALFRRTTAPRVQVRAWAWGGERVLLVRWSFSATLGRAHPVSRPLRVEGMSEITLADDGRVCLHKNYHAGPGPSGRPRPDGPCGRPRPRPDGEDTSG
ncbi:nuclear transport factor 2 family protein [Pararhodospirillum oryzae]|uniref:SnoaL-like domain-containing protein n=1 Tax=Pararhodospirillum oryzae TaxID=478448 RepID=A0A512H739_9PROT|nr:nuclear transport factor 2 family protein [Pararhodospirillum oryzae]GEO81254.1 hypothetical protein ROR02_13850 [Pararhodospirillum oryzae]